ncbi:MAG TPA: SpoIIIAC/SpoIIIAD family protein [Limnochordales bacterium]
MELVGRVAGVALVVAVWLSLLRGRAPELALALLTAFSALALGSALGPLQEVVQLFGRLDRAAGGSGAYLGVVLRAMAIAYVAAFGAQICRDAGQHALGMTVELVGKVAILVTAIPVFVALLDALWRLLPAVA